MCVCITVPSHNTFPTKYTKVYQLLHLKFCKMKYFVVRGSYDVTIYRKLWKNPKNIILKRKSSHCMMYKV